MKLPEYKTDNYAVYEMRGSGVLVRRLPDQKEVFFRPGDAANEVRNMIDALDEVPEGRRFVVFDIAIGEYF